MLNMSDYKDEKKTTTKMADMKTQDKENGKKYN